MRLRVCSSAQRDAAKNMPSPVVPNARRVRGGSLTGRHRQRGPEFGQFHQQVRATPLKSHDLRLPRSSGDGSGPRLFDAARVEVRTAPASVACRPSPMTWLACSRVGTRKPRSAAALWMLSAIIAVESTTVPSQSKTTRIKSVA